MDTNNLKSEKEVIYYDNKVCRAYAGFEDLLKFFLSHQEFNIEVAIDESKPGYPRFGEENEEGRYMTEYPEGYECVVRFTLPKGAKV